MDGEQEQKANGDEERTVLDKNQLHKKSQRSFCLCMESWGWVGVGIRVPKLIHQAWMVRLPSLVCFQLLLCLAHSSLKTPVPVLFVLALCHCDKLPEIKVFILTHSFRDFGSCLLGLITLKACGGKAHDDGSSWPGRLLSSRRPRSKQSRRKGSRFNIFFKVTTQWPNCIPLDPTY